MIDFQQFSLDNGLRVIIHQDKSTTLAAVNVLYDVGSRDEDEKRTGFAHLFEHLMFGGSKHVEQYDEILQRVGGESNAFTSPDLTNYYLTLPSVNLETGLWLESDRMLSLSFNPDVLEVQRKVVIEEFKQRYLNQPYGDAWLKLRPLAYQVHPYKWATIGKDISHIEEATLEDVKGFFFKFYRPVNAILVIAGNVEFEKTRELVAKYFGDIPSGDRYVRQLASEPIQQEERLSHVEADVPLDAIYKVFHMPGRNSQEYHACDLLSDLLGRGKSSHLYRNLVVEEQLFNSLNAYVTGSIDPGLLVISGKINEGVDLEEADNAIWRVIESFKERSQLNGELQKVKNQALTSVEFGEVEMLNRAMNLAFGAVIGDSDRANKEKQLIEEVGWEDVKRMSDSILRRTNCSTLLYKKKAA